MVTKQTTAYSFGHPSAVRKAEWVSAAVSAVAGLVREGDDDHSSDDMTSVVA